MDVKVKVAQLCPTFCNPMDYTVHGIIQARILEWVAFSFSRGSFQTQGSNPGLPQCRWILYQLSYQGSLASCVCKYILCMQICIKYMYIFKCKVS